MKNCVRCYITKQEDCFSFKLGKQLNTCRSCVNEIRRRSARKHVTKYIARECKSRNENPLKGIQHHYRVIPINFLKKGYRSYECVVGCTHQEFREYIESKFQPWMNWNNRSTSPFHDQPYKMWTLDHIIPISSGKSEDELIELSHYTNLQPICSFINNRVKRSFKNYYDVSEWLKIGYNNNNGVCYYKNEIIGSYSNNQDILKIWERHRTLYTYQISQ